MCRDGPVLNGSNVKSAQTTHSKCLCYISPRPLEPYQSLSSVFLSTRTVNWQVANMGKLSIFIVTFFGPAKAIKLEEAPCVTEYWLTPIIFKKLKLLSDSQANTCCYIPIFTILIANVVFVRAAVVQFLLLERSGQLMHFFLDLRIHFVVFEMKKTVFSVNDKFLLSS